LTEYTTQDKSEMKKSIFAIDIEGIVSEKNPPQLVNEPQSMSENPYPNWVSDAKLTDKFGEISLTLWKRDAIDVQVGDYIRIENGHEWHGGVTKGYEELGGKLHIISRANNLHVSTEIFARIKKFENEFNRLKENNDDPELFLSEHGAKFIDASSRGNELYELSGLIPERTLKILKYRDPSTNELYFCFVPDHIEKPDEGMAWKFHLTEYEYENLAREA
tara:strand:+ start:535 stop:1191 length:657 start_codon:yes stop_codon:yes gene_type:complete